MIITWTSGVFQQEGGNHHLSVWNWSVGSAAGPAAAITQLVNFGLVEALLIDGGLVA